MLRSKTFVFELRVTSSFRLVLLYEFRKRSISPAKPNTKVIWRSRIPLPLGIFIQPLFNKKCLLA